MAGLERARQLKRQVKLEELLERRQFGHPVQGSATVPRGEGTPEVPDAMPRSVAWIKNRLVQSLASLLAKDVSNLPRVQATEPTEGRARWAEEPVAEDGDNRPERWTPVCGQGTQSRDCAAILRKYAFFPAVESCSELGMLPHEPRSCRPWLQSREQRWCEVLAGALPCALRVGNPFGKGYANTCPSRQRKRQRAERRGGRSGRSFLAGTRPTMRKSSGGAGEGSRKLPSSRNWSRNSVHSGRFAFSLAPEAGTWWRSGTLSAG